MKIKDIAESLKRGQRIKICAIDQPGEEGEQVWTNSLTDAQIYAYWERRVLAHEEESNTIYCLIS